jgi:lysophospholipase L1-like esterase
VNGKPSFSIPPGALLLTDPVDLEFAPMSDLAVSIYIPGATPGQTQHTLALYTSYISKDGDFTSKTSIDDAKTALSWYWLSSIEVMAPANAATVVAFGDSITDGYKSTPDTNHMWPAVLSQRILSTKGAPPLSVVGEAISGNQILRDGAGVNALARFDHDVISRAGVKWVVILEGINDIGRGLGPAGTPETAVTADELIAGLRQMIERAHAHGIKVLGATLTPYEGAAYYSPKGEVVRQAVNAWIRTGGAYDALIDFDSLTRDPSHPTQFKPEYDCGDHLHPNDTGYKMMADAIDYSIFKR